jgi:hypothetical protein
MVDFDVDFKVSIGYLHFGVLGDGRDEIGGLNSTGARNYVAFAINVVKLDAFSWNAFVADRIFIENILNFLLLIFEAHHIDHLEFSSDLHRDSFNILHALIDPVIKSV